MTRDFSLRQANPGIEVSVKPRMAQSLPSVPVAPAAPVSPRSPAPVAPVAPVLPFFAFGSGGTRLRLGSCFAGVAFFALGAGRAVCTRGTFGSGCADSSGCAGDALGAFGSRGSGFAAFALRACGSVFALAPLAPAALSLQDRSGVLLSLLALAHHSPPTKWARECLDRSVASCGGTVRLDPRTGQPDQALGAPGRTSSWQSAGTRTGLHVIWSAHSI